MPHNKKSTIKRIGVKSAFSHGSSRLTITKFGRGNDAEIAVDTDSRGQGLAMPHRVEKSFTINRIDEEIDVQRSGLLGTLLNPAENDPADYLGLKSTLEKEFFGQEFPNDSIRIQIIHNILDIQKILGIYINDVLYSIANLQNKQNPKEILGQSMNSETIEGLLPGLRPYMGLLGAGFKPYLTGPWRNDKQHKEADEYNAKVLKILSAVRHDLAHYKRDSVLFSRKLETGIQGIKKDDWTIINEHYSGMIKRINRSFLTNSKTNLVILFEILATPPAEQKKIVEEYYGFSILKQGKNLGINMKKLRELITEQFFAEIKDKSYDSIRQKVYTILDFVLFRIVRDSNDLPQILQELRDSENDEKKEEVYKKSLWVYGPRLKSQIGDFLEKIRTEISVFTTTKLEVEMDSRAFLTDEAEPLVKLLAFLCNFWDGKEVNEILSVYVHKFESIQSFLDTLRDLNDEAVFTSKFDAFNSGNFAGNAADQLRILASIGKMKPDLAGAKRALFHDAIETLGIIEHSDWLGEDGVVNDEMIDQYILAGSKVSQAEREKINPFRNFIANNVIESRRFIYLARYSKPKAVRALMNHPEIVKYVLTRLPEKQIDTYFANISDDENISVKLKIEKLKDRLTGFSFDLFLKNKEGIIDNTKLSVGNKNVEIERLKALTGLYLTVAFVAVKNLVKATARYFIAFSAFERDYALMLQKDPDLKSFSLVPEGRKPENIYALTEYYLKKEEENDYHPEPGQPFDKEACRKHLDSIRRHFTKKWRDIFRKEIDEALQIHPTGLLGRAARNQVEHLNVVMDALPKYVGNFARNEDRTKKWRMTSYFRLYHYLMQRIFCDAAELNIPEEWKKKILETGLPSKNLIHACFVSLGYNLARYKNLTTEALFDEDSEPAKEGKKG